MKKFKKSFYLWLLLFFSFQNSFADVFRPVHRGQTVFHSRYGRMIFEYSNGSDVVLRQPGTVNRVRVPRSSISIWHPQPLSLCGSILQFIQAGSFRN
jgi:hypothetical protein